MTTSSKMAYAERKDRAEAIYNAQIRQHIAPEDEDKFVKIDVLSGDYELDENSITAGRRLRERRPDAVIHTMHHHRTRVVKIRSPRNIVRNTKAAQ